MPNRLQLTSTAVVSAAMVGAFALPAAAAVSGHSGNERPAALSAAASTDAQGEGLREFQAQHGLEQTGKTDTRTAKELSAASDTELHKVFQSAQDLGPQELANARTVIGVGRGAGFSDQGIVIALMTAMQESKFVNYTVPQDHDSLGIFQQRPSTRWGIPEQITDVVLSSKSFYGVADFGTNPGLAQIPDWPTMAPGDPAQAVQRSAFPGEYAQWEGFARDLLTREGPTVPPIP